MKTNARTELRSRKLAIKLVAGAAALVIGAAQGAPVADLSGDFSGTANPAGSWTYGSSAVLGGSFAAFTNLGALALHVPVWNSGGLYPFVAKNEGSADYVGSTATYEPDDVAFHPGAGGEFAIARYVVQAPGWLELDVAFSRLDTAYPTTSSVHVMLNGVPLFDGELDAAVAQLTFAATLAFAAGDRIDFAVGYGANGDYFGDATGVAATLATASSTVAEPAVWWVLLAGGLLLRARRRMVA